jgi:hypothetical protein
MSKNLLFSILAVLQMPVPAQQRSTLPAAGPERAAQIRANHEELMFRTREQEARVTKEYAAARLSRIRGIAQEQVLDALRLSDRAGDEREALLSVMGNLMGDSSARGGGTLKPTPGSPFVYSTEIQGIRTLVVGYYVLYGGGALPNAAVVIQGFRKAGLEWEPADATGTDMTNCELQLEQLNSPRSNEAWFFAHGFHFGYMGSEEMVRLYSFDGYQFKELWAPEEPRVSPSYQITKDKIVITYEEERPSMRHLRDTILLSNGGPVASTEIADSVLPPLEVKP